MMGLDQKTCPLVIPTCLLEYKRAHSCTQIIRGIVLATSVMLSRSIRALDSNLDSSKGPGRVLGQLPAAIALGTLHVLRGPRLVPGLARHRRTRCKHIFDTRRVVEMKIFGNCRSLQLWKDGGHEPFDCRNPPH